MSPPSPSPDLIAFPGSHRPRDTQLDEDAQRYAQRNGVQVLALLCTLALNLLRCNGFRSIRAGLMAVAHDISRMLGWVGINTADTGSIDFQSALGSTPHPSIGDSSNS